MALTTPQEEILTRPACCEYASGRVFYGSRNTIYYSQVLEGVSMSNLSKCYQQNDPTSEHISDLLDTDGGTIQIDNATKIIQLKKFGRGVLIYSTNGVWYLSGTEGGFTATNFSLSLIDEAGCISAQSVVTVENTHYYWSSEGIYVVAENEFGKAVATNIIQQTMQSQYNDIPVESKKKATGVYNRIKKQVEWFYPSTAQDGTDEYRHANDASLVLDTRMGGMWPQEYIATQAEAEGQFIGCAVNTNQGTEEYDAIQVVIELDAPSTTQVYNVNFGAKISDNFTDFDTNYETAYIETGYETLDKPSNKKAAPYITTHFLQTELNWVDDGSGGLMLDNQSGCQMQAKWDWNNSDSNGRWSPAQQAYRFRRVFVPSVAGAFNSGEQVITTKNKMLGRGNALSIRFEQEDNKDMQLLGYTTTYSVKGRM